MGHRTTMICPDIFLEILRRRPDLLSIRFPNVLHLLREMIDCRNRTFDFIAIFEELIKQISKEELIKEFLGDNRLLSVNRADGKLVLLNYPDYFKYLLRTAQGLQIGANTAANALLMIGNTATWNEIIGLLQGVAVESDSGSYGSIRAFIGVFGMKNFSNEEKIEAMRTILGDDLGLDFIYTVAMFINFQLVEESRHWEPRPWKVIDLQFESAFLEEVVAKKLTGTVADGISWCTVTKTLKLTVISIKIQLLS